MEAIILTREHLKELQDQIKDLSLTINSKLNPDKEFVWNNDEFADNLKISKRTAQTWRDKGLINFSQVGSVILYTRKDIESFLNKHRKGFAKYSKR